MKKRNFLIIFLLTVVLAAGMLKYSFHDEITKKDSIEVALLEKSQETDPNISTLALKYSEIKDFGVYYNFICETNDKIYEGMAIESNDMVQKIDLAEIDSQACFTVHTLSGAIKNKDGSKSLFYACSGKINDNSIEKIHLFFEGGKMYEIRIGKNQFYNVVISDQQPSVIKIEGIDKNGITKSVWSKA